jgi:uncharacterized protein YjbI with pentapeptide repeats
MPEVNSAIVGLRDRVARVRNHTNGIRYLGAPVIVVVVLMIIWLVFEAYLDPTDTAGRKDLIAVFGPVAAATVLLLGLHFTHRNVQIAQEGQLTERFTRSIDQLGKINDSNQPQIEVRLGGIYALGRIARDSKRDRQTILDILAAYVRESSRSAPYQQPQHDSLPQEPKGPRIDIQAALTVTTRIAKDFGTTHHARLNFWGAHLQSVALEDGHLAGAELRDAHLDGALLRGANLGPRRNEAGVQVETRMEESTLLKANLIGATLTRAHLDEADLTGADLRTAILVQADLRGAILTDADLRSANLKGARLEKAVLVRTDLSGADLSGVVDLSQDQIDQAYTEGAILSKGIRHSQLKKPPAATYA